MNKSFTKFSLLFLRKFAPGLIFLLVTLTSAIAQPPNNMTAGTYTLTGSVATWYDPGGAGGGVCPSVAAGNYANSLNIIETMTANPGQKIILTWNAGLFGLASGDFLTLYDGPNTTFPILASYNSATPATPIPATVYTTSNSITFLFISDATNTCKGWQAAVSAYYFMQPGNFTFNCPGTYTFVDYQLSNSSGIGGDASCTTGGSQANYQDVSLVETFFTGNGQCIQIDQFPSTFGLCANDVLTVYDGPSILSPIANGGTATWTNTFVNPGTVTTLGNSATFEFLQDGPGTTHARGWRMTMSCVNCPAASINNDCVNAIIVTPGASCNSIASSVSVSNSLQSGMPACVGTPNDDVWYRFTANNATTQITVAPTDGTMDVVVQLLSGTCGSFTSLYCQNAGGAGVTETINATGLTPGTTYYVRVYDFAAANANHNFNICVVGAANTDCVAAQQVCNTTFNHSNNNYPDFGAQEYNSSYWGCEVSGEARSAWYYWQIATSGRFGFNIYSTSGASQDNDFALWGPLTGLNCPMSTSPLRCSWAIPYFSNGWGLPNWSTGLQTGAGDNTESAGGDAFVETVNATAGQWYVLVVNIYAGPNTYTISWMDNIPTNQQATFINPATGTSCSLLPIELLSFTGENVGVENVLTWTTASEINNDYFAIERSPDGEHFTELGTVKAAGTSIAELKYNFPDESPLGGINYYRLRQTDFDGTYTYSNIIALDNGSITPVVPFVYPNPSQGVFNVNLMAASKGDVTLQVFNAIGQLVTATKKDVQSGQNNFNVDLSSFNQGIYTLMIRDNRSGYVYTNKIVKM